jgi:phosphoribosylaminoimidazolecarboxamide formyltransferase/IMP cyclohydrolase
LEKFALISVSDKTKLVEFAQRLKKLNYKILATGGTAKLLTSSGVENIEISNFTGFPEIFDGRVKTLHPKIFGGILFRRKEAKDIEQAKQNNIQPIDIVCVNLYPFDKVAANENSHLDELIENIDIGGPSLIRASAKNYKYISVLTNPIQYESFINELQNGEVSVETKKKLALDAFSYTSSYDTLIANTLEKRFDIPSDSLRINLKKTKTLRYGENPHQQAEVYGNLFNYFEILHGKELSYNNILDVIASVELIEELEENSCAIIKHNNPAGVATTSNIYDSYVKALSCDPVSAFGGIVTFNDVVDEKIAAKLNEIFLEVIIASAYTEAALSVLAKKKDRRLLKQIKPLKDIEYQIKSIPGGFLKQNSDRIKNDFDNLKIITKREPTQKELEDLKFAWIVSKNTKSNTIVFAKDKMTLGIGAGQVSRIDSAKIAAIKAKEFNFDLTGTAVASDAFFPFADGLLEVVKYGATSVIQPGGSVRDQEVIDAANQKNISMVFTGIRHFKH